MQTSQTSGTEPSADQNPDSSAAVQATVKKRSRKACHHCHARKIRCNVAERGVPCTNCVDADTACVIRRRKNQRADLALTHSDGQPETVPHPPGRRPAQLSEETRRQEMLVIDNYHGSKRPLSPPPDTGEHRSPWREESSRDPSWHPKSLPPESISADTTSSGNSSADYSHLIDLDDMLIFNGLSMPEVSPAGPFPGARGLHSSSATPMSSLHIRTPATGCIEDSTLQAKYRPLVEESHFDFLRSQNCFDLPTARLLRPFMERYFLVVHPHLPIIPEDEFWALWADDEFRSDGVSLVLLRAMMFAAISYVDFDVLSGLGMATRRDARRLYYNQAKLLYDFGVERDPVANAQACLLMSYHAPVEPILVRMNNAWVAQALRWCRTAKAESYHRCPDPVRAKLLKRLWWGLIFRDRTISLGLRRSFDVRLGPEWGDARHVLREDDFNSEIGRSAVHDETTQRSLLEMISSTCRLMQVLSPALEVLHREESLTDQLEMAAESEHYNVVEIRSAIEGLHHWHEHAIRSFPYPVNLGDTHKSICIYANMMFQYYSTAMLALGFRLALTCECLPGALALMSGDEARKLVEAANEDMTRRSLELVQAQVAQFLPISSAALIMVPMFLQAINVAAARGSGIQSSEIRRLEIFRKLLSSQQENFDAPNFCAKWLIKVVNYAQSDISSMSTYGDAKDHSASSSSAYTGRDKTKSDWASILHKRPRLLLRLVSYIDLVLRHGGPPTEEEFPPALRKIPPISRQR